jgi:TIR domain
LLVLLSRAAIASEAFWRGLAAWKLRPVVPMVVCLMPKAELYRDPPSDTRKELWAWLGDNVAVELTAETDRYVVLLRALDSPDPKQWWWHEGDAIELGLAVDVLGNGIPLPSTRRKPTGPTREPYPYTVDGTLLAAFFLASERLTRDESSGRDARYFAVCRDLLELRQAPGGEPYALPWFVLIYRTWLAFAAGLPGFAYSEADAAHAERELWSALFALGIGTQPSEVPTFLEAFAHLPWTTPPPSIAAVDERTIAFMVLVHHLSHAALARAQRMRLEHPACSCFISYARPDEGFARELVTQLEAKGADVWWDLNAITLGTPLDESLRSAVGDARFLFLIATPAADQSLYVRLEVETAIRQGLHIVPIAPEGRLPTGLQTLLASAPGSFEPFISALDADRATALASALARLQRTSDERLRWLQSQGSYKSLHTHLTQTRAALDQARPV